MCGKIILKRILKTCVVSLWTGSSNGFYERVNKTSGPTYGVKFFDSLFQSQEGICSVKSVNLVAEIMVTVISNSKGQ